MRSWIPALAGLLVLLASGCKPPDPPRPAPVAEPPRPKLEATVRSTPDQALISLKDQVIGPAPQSLSVETVADLLQLKAVLGASEAAEKRIRFITPMKAEIHFLFGKEQSPLARSLGLSRVLVFDYGEGITFDVDRAELRPAFSALLDRQAEMLAEHFPGLDIYVCGHTDSSGNASHNLALSLARAQTVARYLITRGVPAARLKVQGFGSAFPVAANDTAEGKALNRRTEIVLPQ